MSKKPSLADQLAKAAEGLVLPSEHDSPFTVVHFPNAELPADAKAVRKLIGVDTKTPIEAFDPEALLARLGTDSPDDGADVKTMRAKYRKLATFLADHFDRRAGFRVGKLHVDTYLLARAPDGDLLGLKASGVET